MRNEHPANEVPVRPVRKTPIHQRSVRVGRVIVINGSHVNRAQLRQQFVEAGYQTHATLHFLLFLREVEPKLVLVHWFSPKSFHSDLSHYLVEELRPYGVITSNQVLGELMTGIIGGTLFPDDVRKAWNYFGANTLQHLLTLVCSTLPSVPLDCGSLGASASLYQRVFELSVGERFLDAACNGGFFPLLLAERIPFVQEVVGVDIDAAVFSVAQALAKERGLSTVRFVQANLLAADFSTIGTFDMVTALHVLEHFTETEMYQVLSNLLKVTRRRFIFAVPFEAGEPSAAYDHRQVFTREKVEAVGAWCVAQLQRKARLWYEEISPRGGLLLVERLPL